MTRGKKVVSKTGQSSPRELRKSLRFGGRGSGGEEDVSSQNMDAVEEACEDIGAVHQDIEEENINTVSMLLVNFCSVPYKLSLLNSSLEVESSFILDPYCVLYKILLSVTYSPRSTFVDWAWR